MRTDVQAQGDATHAHEDPPGHPEPRVSNLQRHLRQDERTKGTNTKGSFTLNESEKVYDCCQSLRIMPHLYCWIQILTPMVLNELLVLNELMVLNELLVLN